jgi:hypothetical protein
VPGAEHVVVGAVVAGGDLVVGGERARRACRGEDVVVEIARVGVRAEVHRAARALFDEDRVGAGAGIDRVLAAAVADEVVAAARIDRVVAQAGEDAVIGVEKAAGKAIRPVAAGDPVVAGVGVDVLVGGARHGDDVVAEIGDEEVEVLDAGYADVGRGAGREIERDVDVADIAQPETVPGTGAAIDGDRSTGAGEIDRVDEVVAVVAEELVPVAAAADGVAALAAMDDVSVGIAEVAVEGRRRRAQRVVAGAAVERVGAGAADDVVVTGIAEEVVVAARTKDRVIAGIAVDGVVAVEGAATDEVVLGRDLDAVAVRKDLVVVVAAVDDVAAAAGIDHVVAGPHAHGEALGGDPRATGPSASRRCEDQRLRLCQRARSMAEERRATPELIDETIGAGAADTANPGVAVARAASRLGMRWAFVIGGVAVLVAAIVLPQLRFEDASGSTAPPAAQSVAAKPSAEGVAGHKPSQDVVDLHLNGLFYWNKRTPDDLNRAVHYFNQAISEDPNYAEAYVGLANSYNLLREYTLMPAEEAYPRARAAAERAIALDDMLSEAHTALAFVEFYWYRNFDKAKREFERARALDPDSVRVRQIGSARRSSISASSRHRSRSSPGRRCSTRSRGRSSPTRGWSFSMPARRTTRSSS